MTTTATYAVAGMHCSSCVMNVEEIVLEIPGVTDAEASFRKGQLTVSHDGSVSDDQVRAAIVEAGYQPA